MTSLFTGGGGAIMPRVWLVTIGLVGLCLPLVSACAGNDVGQGAAPDRIRAVVLPFMTAAPFYIAADEGYFEEQNLDVEFVKLARNLEAIPALARGEVDVGFGQLTITVLNAVASGAPIKLVAGTGYLARDGCTLNAVVARRALVDAGRLDEPEQLLGLRVELDVLLPAAYYVDRLLQPAGLSIDDLDIVNLPMPSNIDALIGGSIDVTVASEPYLTRLVESGEAVVWRPSQQIVPDFPTSSVMFGQSLLDERPEVGERFMVAFRKAMHQYELGKTPRNVDILTRGTGLTREVLRDTCWPAFRKDAQVDTERLVAFQEWLESRALIDRVIPQDELVDRRFVEHANAVLDP
jgi:NitT/TauT family transport system substrate-binding protein